LLHGTNNGHLDVEVTFAIYAGLTAIALVFIAILLPAARGRTLEKIEYDWLKTSDGEAQKVSKPLAAASDPEEHAANPSLRE